LIQIRIENWDGDAATLLPKELLTQLGIKVGDTLHMEVTARGITLSVHTTETTLSAGRSDRSMPT